MSINITFHGNNQQPESLGIGVFDGIHQGHQALLNQCDTLLTFNPHPVTLIKQIDAIKRLTTLPEMTYYVPHLISLEFNKTIQNLSAIDFLDQIILKKINPKKVVIGYDYHFGNNREGTPQFFYDWGKKNNIEVTIIKPVSHENTIVKSRQIRSSIEQGNFNQAIEALGHPYLIIGKVTKGDNRGKTLGFPTANLQVAENKLIPNNGVYKGHVLINNTPYKAMIYIGNRPTFNTSHSIEVFILNYDKNLYNQELYVFVTQFLRQEIKFQSQDQLIEQIHKDIAIAYDD